MIQRNKHYLLALSILAACSLVSTSAMAQEKIKLGLSLPLSGAGAPWGIGADWLCKKAAAEIAEAGGVKVKDKTYNFECVSYDNKYNAADGAKVAQALVSKDGIKFIAGSIGTAPVRALQSLTERRGVLLFTSAWGASIKGPKFPLTFTQMSTTNEISGPMTKYVAGKYPIKTVALLNPNDATGQEAEKIARQAWEDAGVKVVSSDWYERGNSEFQPVAAKVSALKPDAVDLCSTPPADSGLVFKELAGMGWDGVKVVEVGTGADGLLATGGKSVEGVYLGAAISMEGPNSNDHQRALDAGVRKATGDSINAVQIGTYDAVYALKAGMEKAQSIDPKDVAKALPTVRFQSFYGESGFGGEKVYGSPQQMLLPVIVTQLRDGKLIEITRLSAESQP
ncbi:ABC transporter substrate-binding protein [Allopusillimonas ginsengisoli]|uniref:ABC transporter substrate-binding protein n=1 Tax=Allopusillimonas ginsengisoli TaxID=453575 RepID=UPI00101E9A4B|nr:ABC transporter substrate-binding protein [Allopusillimonas ginsengisoli]TEA77235.1 amino acid ABC transporter substrate-binding protein [Allopusillimonas ginsengisoli]